MHEDLHERRVHEIDMGPKLVGPKKMGPERLIYKGNIVVVEPLFWHQKLNVWAEKLDQANSSYHIVDGPFVKTQAEIREPLRRCGITEACFSFGFPFVSTQTFKSLAPAPGGYGLFFLLFALLASLRHVLHHWRRFWRRRNVTIPIELVESARKERRQGCLCHKTNTLVWVNDYRHSANRRAQKEGQSADIVRSESTITRN